MAVGVFAGIPVRDYDSALEWYKRLLGAEPAFYPNDIEAVWQLAEDRYVYIIQDPERAGGAVSMIWVDDPVAGVTLDNAKLTTAFDFASRPTIQRRLSPTGVELTATSVTFDANGNALSTTDARGNTSTFTYDATPHPAGGSLSRAMSMRVTVSVSSRSP